MGVPGLYRWISDTFRSTMLRARLDYGLRWENMGRDKRRVDNFFVDGVSILHIKSSQVFGYGAYEHKCEYTNLGTEEKVQKVYELVYDYVMELYKFTRPRKHFYISFDGVAPLAKQAQQRQRRFQTTSSGEFDKNMISTGTRFTYDFCRYVESRLSTESFGCSVTFSDSNTPGEGEHKVIEFIRRHDFSADRNVMYGPDGDLVMLTLATHLPDFWVIHDDHKNYLEMVVTDIGKLRNMLYTHLSTGTEDPDTVITDFILLSFFLGNDFLPRLTIIDLFTDGMDVLINHYVRTKKRASGWSLTSDNTIRMDCFIEFTKSLSQNEEALLVLRAKKRHPDPRFVCTTIRECVHNNFFDYKKFQSYYYTKKLGSPPPLVVSEYIKGLQWVLTYYTQGCPDWRWAYPYHHAPLVAHLTVRAEYMPFEENIAYEPFRQLMCVIPPSSVGVLPECLHVIYDNPDTKVFYPEVFEMDYEGKRYDWQGTALLPHINQYLLDELYERVKVAHPHNDVHYDKNI